MTSRRSFLWLLGFVVLAGCSDEDGDGVESGGAQDPKVRTAGTITFSKPGGKLAFIVNRTEDEWKMIDAHGREQFRVKKGPSGRYRFDDVGELFLGKVEGAPPLLKIMGRSRDSLRYRFREQQEGIWILEGPEGDRVCKAERRNGSWNLAGPLQTSLTQVTQAQGRTSLLRGDGTVVFITDDPISSLGALALALPLSQTESLALMAALTDEE